MVRVERVLEPCQRMPAKRGWAGGPSLKLCVTVLVEIPSFSTVQVQLSLSEQRRRHAEDRECVFASLCFVEKLTRGLEHRGKPGYLAGGGLWRAVTDVCGLQVRVTGSSAALWNSNFRAAEKN